MKRPFTSLFLLLSLLCGASAQGISQYEYWTDDDYAARSTASASDGNISLNVATETLTAGVHFFNFRAGRSDGVWGNFYRYLYYVPTLKSAVPGGVNVEYWLDDNLAAAKSEAANGGNLSLALDISTLSSGVHYFNCTPVAVTGERGSSERYLFYVPQSFDIASVAAVKGFEYWLDDDYAGKTVKEDASATPVLTLNIDGLGSGVHYFNCRAYNERGEYGNPVRKMFYIPKTQVNQHAEIAKAEYWLDDDYAGKVSLETSDTEQAFTVDISLLAPGVHYLNYRAIDSDGTTGSMIREMFYLPHSQDSGKSELISYEYWIDGDTANKVSGGGSTSPYVFNIDVTGLSYGVHTFSFRAKNLLEQWGETFVEEFELSNPTAIDIMETPDGDVHDVYTLGGYKVKSQATIEELKSLPSGIYIYGGKKILVP